MKLWAHILFFGVMLISFNNMMCANDFYKPTKDPRAQFDNTINARVHQNFGYRNFGWEADVTYQVKQWFSIGVGSGMHRNKMPIWSASDKHVLKIWSFPVYAYANVIVLGNANRAFYVYGKFGKSIGKNSSSVKVDRTINERYIEGGLGYQIINYRNHVYFELGQFYTTANGNFSSTYNSDIKYSLEIYNLVLRMGLKI